MEENKKKGISIPRLVFAVVLLVFSIFYLKNTFPDLTFPVINNYSNPPEKASLNGSPFKYYYEDLSNIEKWAYNMILDSIYDMPEKILVPDLNEDELDHVFFALLSDNPDLFFIGRKCSVTAELWNDFFSVDYIVDKSEYTDMKDEFDSACRDVLAVITKPDDSWQTELEIHDYIVDHTAYKLENNKHIYSSSYGCLVNGSAGCEGYSKAMKQLLDMTGIQSYVVTGNAKNENSELSSHMWNCVCINEEWYHLDCTWDDPVSSDGRHYKMYNYFNLSDSEISSDHFDYVTKTDCSSSAANYYIKKGLIFDSYSRPDEQSLKEVIAAEYNAGHKKITIKFATKKAFDNAHKDLIENKRLGNVLLSIKRAGNITLADKADGYIENEDQRTLTLLFK